MPTPRAGGPGYDVVLYDAVAGGAGHCRELLERWRELLEATRQRLDCPNERCTGACHRCLLAFETQRYELVLARTDLREFLEPRWPHLMDQLERGGLPVAPLMRSGAQLSEILARQPAAAVIIAAPEIAAQATDQSGWLRKLLHHAMGHGSVALAIERLPDPNVDDERVLCRALQAAIESSSLALYRVVPGTAQRLGFRMITANPDAAYAIEGDDTLDGLGPNWLANDGEGGPTRVFEASTDAGRKAAKAALQALLVPANRIEPAALNPSSPPESVVIREIPAMASGNSARFEQWFRNGRNQPVWQSGPFKRLSIQDPYLWNEWQLSLLAEVIELFKNAKCPKIMVNTHPPREDDGFGSKSLSAQEQLVRIQRMLGDASWRPIPAPTSAEKRAGKRAMHQRFIEGEREDGSKFLILLERGLDFIESRWEPRRREQVRMTRASYLVVKDPA